jgi:hypothetical protein
MASRSGSSRGYLVECFTPGVDRAAVEDTAARAGAVALELRRQGHAIEYQGALLVPVDEVVLHRFRSESPALVREAAGRAAMTFERVLDVVAIDPE